MSYRFHRAALAEHLDQVAFYESRQPGLGADYLEEFDGLMARVVQNAQAYPAIGSSALRRAGMRRFPFHVIYLVHDMQIVIVAIAHHRRRPAYWVERIAR